VSYRITNNRNSNTIIGKITFGPYEAKTLTTDEIAALKPSQRRAINELFRTGELNVKYSAPEATNDALPASGVNASAFGQRLLLAADGEEALEQFGMIEADGVSVNGTFETFYDPSSQLNVLIELQADGKAAVPNGGLSIITNRVGEDNPYGEDRHDLALSLASMTGRMHKTPQTPGGNYIGKEWYLDHQGLTFINSLYENPDNQIAMNSVYIAFSNVPDPVSGFSVRTLQLPWRAGTFALEEPNVVTTTSAATLTPTFSNGITQLTAMAGPCTIAAPTGTAINGKLFVFRFLAASADRALTWNVIYKPIGVSLPATAPVGKWVYVEGYYNSISDGRVDITRVNVEA